MSPPDGFLSRWSRRKREARALGDAEPAPREAPAAAAAALPELSAEDIAALPRLEDLTAEADLLPFLRAGVPALLRREALRRMWALDPAIRDFVGEARDYSYDWNVPGGVPCSGPLLPTDDPEATLSRLFSRPEPPEPDEEARGADAAAEPDRPPPGSVAENRNTPPPYPGESCPELPPVIPGGCEAAGKGIQGHTSAILDPLPLRCAPAGDDTDRSCKGLQDEAVVSFRPASQAPLGPLLPRPPDESDARQTAPAQPPQPGPTEAGPRPIRRRHGAASPKL